MGQSFYAKLYIHVHIHVYLYIWSYIDIGKAFPESLKLEGKAAAI